MEKNGVGLRITANREAEGEQKMEQRLRQPAARPEMCLAPLTIDPSAQQVYRKPAAVGTMQAGGNFGLSVVVGAIFENSSNTGGQAGAGTSDESDAAAGAVGGFLRKARPRLDIHGVQNWPVACHCRAAYF